MKTYMLKFGAQALLQTYFDSSQQVGGIFNFNGQYTKQLRAVHRKRTRGLSAGLFPRQKVFPTGHFYSSERRCMDYSRKDVLESDPASYAQSGVSRHDIHLPPVDLNNKIVNFNIDSDPSAPQSVAAAPGSWNSWCFCRAPIITR